MTPYANRPFSRPSVVAARRACVVTEARLLFLRLGFHATSVAQISERSGVALQQLYRDFGNKDAIVEEVIRYEISKLLDAIAMAEAADADLTSWLTAVACAYCDDCDPGLLLMAHVEALRNPRIAKLLGEHDGRIRNALIGGFSRFASGAMRRVDLEAAVETMLMAICGLTRQRVPPSALDRHHILAALAEMFKRPLS